MIKLTTLAEHLTTFLAFHSRSCIDSLRVHLHQEDPVLLEELDLNIDKERRHKTDINKSRHTNLIESSNHLLVLRHIPISGKDADQGFPESRVAF